jgi:hypothetical protein
VVRLTLLDISIDLTRSWQTRTRLSQNLNFGAAGTPFPAACILQGVENIAHIKTFVSANGVAETPMRVLRRFRGRVPPTMFYE